MAFLRTRVWGQRTGAMSESGAHREAYSREPLAWVPYQSEQIALYCGNGDMRTRIKRLLASADLETARSRETFTALVRAGCSLSVVGLEKCSGADAVWLHDAVGRSLGGQSCVVVAPLSLSNLQCLRELGRDIFRVVWDEEVDDRLVTVLDEVSGDTEWRADPLRSLGRRLLSNQGLRPSVRKVVSEICHLTKDDASPPPPRRQVTELARMVYLAPATLCRYWKADVPMRCGPKQLLRWAALLWAVDRRSEVKWDAVARQMGVRRRTLERHCSDLAECTLAEAAREPGMVWDRFRAWVARVSELG